MKYAVDHDMHIHSLLSSCSRDPLQTSERILQYAKDNGFNTVAVTDHFWDDAVEGASSWYMPQNYEHLCEVKPLPKADGIRFLFGCETELNKELTLGISREKVELFDFINIPITHFHMKNYTLTEEEAESAATRAEAWVIRLSYVLSLDLPFYKVGLAHLTCPHISHPREEYLKVLDLIPESDMERLFLKAAKLGVGIELNASDLAFSDEEADTVLRPYRIAKKCGCKFFCGSDAHHPDKFEVSKALFERAVDLIGLEEDDKFTV